jgi:cytochrome bd-type quinol oxidase subunit 2
VFSVGRAYRNACESPRLIAVIGMWLIFGSQVPVLLFGLFLTLSNVMAPGHRYVYRNGSSMTSISDGTLLELTKLLVLIGLLVLYVAILRKVTVRYIYARRAAMHNQPFQWSGAARGFPVIPVPPERGSRTERI